MTEYEIIAIIITLVFLEGILSIDNAAVLGAMALQLPDDKPVPWPRFLRRYAAALNRVFGPQRGAALKVGLFGAYAGRALMLVLATWIIHNPWLQLIGALYLLKLSFEGLAVHPETKGNSNSTAGTSSDFWTVVLAIELADLAFSLDNVVAAVAISDQLWIVLVGVGIGIVTMRFAANVFGWLIRKEPLLSRAAYLLVFVIGVEILVEHFFHVEIAHWLRFTTSLGIIGLTIVYSRTLKKTVVNRLFNSLGLVFYYLNELLNIILVPFKVSTAYTARRTFHSSKRIGYALQLALRFVERRLRREH